MLLSLTTTHSPATDLGYLLSKHPDRLHTLDLPFGNATVFYPVANAQSCTASLLLEIDPVGLVRGRGAGEEGLLAQYVNDRPYVASSFLCVALKRAFNSAMAGNCRDRPELVDTAIPLVVDIPVLRSRGGAERVQACFEPLGYAVETEQLALDLRFPEWGESPYLRLRLSAQLRLRDLLNHLYVLLPALDGDKHYFVGADEVDKLLAKAGDWLGKHPEREWITRRYLKRQPALVKAALARLLDQDEEQIETTEEQREALEASIETPLSLNEQRMAAVMTELTRAGASSVLDLGCGEGRMLRQLLEDPQFQKITGVDVSLHVLERAARRLKLDRLPPLKRQRIELLHGALTYRDQRFNGFDAAIAIEVIEHLDPPRLPAFERVLFEFARPKTLLITTPNAEYNVLFESLPNGRMRHPDHRFEWTRAEFRQWAEAAAARHGYQLRIEPIGALHEQFGAPTQMGVFSR